MALAIVNPFSYLEEYTSALCQVLRGRGYQVILSTTMPQPTEARMAIIFGLMYYLPPTLPYIAVQLELTTSAFFTPEYLQRLKKANQVWELNRTNLSFLQDQGIRATYVPLGRVPTTLLNLEEESYDLVFLGLLNPRRKQYLTFLRKAGLSIYVSDSTFKQAKERCISQARLVLNLHTRPDSRLELLRIIPTLSAGKLVISESVDKLDSLEDIEIAEFGRTPEEILHLCRHWLSVSPQTRQDRALELLAQIPTFEQLIPWEQLA